MNLNQIVQKPEGNKREIIEKNIGKKEISKETSDTLQQKINIVSKENTQNSKEVHKEDKIQINKEIKKGKETDNSNKIILNQSIKEEIQEQMIEKMQKESQRSKKSVKEENKYEEKAIKKQESTFSFTGPPKEINTKLPRIEQNVIDSEKKLILTINEGLHLPSNSQIIINAAGYVNSLRKEYDGITYFGNEEQYNELSKNDFISPAEKSGFGKRHFLIQYKPGELKRS